MMATGYTLAGGCVIIFFGLIGCCVYAKPSGAYDEVEDADATLGLQSELKMKKYAKVDAATDA